MLSLLALIVAVIAGLFLATIGSPGLASAVGASLLMGSTVAVVTFVVLERVTRRRMGTKAVVGPRAEVVSSAIPGLDDHDEAMVAAAAGWDSRPDPFAVGWQEAARDPATGETELRAWQNWTSTLSEESAAEPVWTDEPRGPSFDFKRWLPGSADHDTVQLPMVSADPAEGVGSEPVTALDPVPVPPVDRRIGRPRTGFPEFAPWPAAPWRSTGHAVANDNDRVDA